MGLKNDNWIRQMAREHGMIEPFVDHQIREGVISYGVSSYGYDIRVADEFKIFTNVFSAVVDPKQFDTRSMVDFKGDVCIIPPNSFALAKTVEYFRIPRKVLTICLGKCLTGDTRVVDADTGDYLPLEEFVRRKTPRTLSLNGDRLAVSNVAAHLDNGVKPVFKLTTRLGQSVKATATHPFLTPHGWAPLDRLHPGDAIAVARQAPVFGREDWPLPEALLAGYALAGGQAQGGSGADPVVAGAVARAAEQVGGRLPLSQAPEESVPAAAFRATRAAARVFLQALLTTSAAVVGQDGAEQIEVPAATERLAGDIHHLLLRFGVVSRVQPSTGPDGAPACRVQIAGPEWLRRFAAEIGFIPGSQPQRQLDRLVAGAFAARLEAAGVTAMPQATFSWPDASPETAAATGEMAQAGQDVIWDAVETIQPAGDERVYDLTVPDGHNFLANDIIVHNSTYARCGLIVNVTPFEPEWEGFVTLEISNTTPLPARIYANEGIAQVLFFEADEECQVSYADKKGKYQHQQSIILPKI